MAEQKNEISLDVGCGWNYKGDVNVDLFLNQDIPNREEEQTRYRNHKAYVKRRIPNLICADCHMLPFRNGTFNTVYCNHLLEHKGVDHNRASRELLRVTKNKLVVSVPGLLCFSAKATLHDKVFRCKNFHRMFKRFHRKVRLTRFSWEYVLTKHTPKNMLRRLFLHKRKFNGKIRRFLLKIPCPFPTEIVCEVWKN